jgi:hypothetical protein
MTVAPVAVDKEGDSVGGAIVVVTFSFKRHHLMQALT